MAVNTYKYKWMDAVYDSTIFFIESESLSIFTHLTFIIVEQYRLKNSNALFYFVFRLYQHCCCNGYKKGMFNTPLCVFERLSNTYFVHYIFLILTKIYKFT